LEKVHVVWIDTGTVANPDDRVYGGLIVDYRQNDMEGHVRLGHSRKRSYEPNAKRHKRACRA